MSVYTLIPAPSAEVARPQSTAIRFREPRLAQALEHARAGWRSNLRAIFSGGRAPRKFETGEHFRDCYVGRHTPAGSLAWSVLWHIVFAALIVQFGRFVLRLPETSAFSDVHIVWQGAAEDLPLISPATDAAKPAPAPKPVAQTPKPVDPPPGAQAFHPTQTIVSAPKVITHPSQTLVRPDLPQVAPKILPPLPNIVELQSEPERPKLQITQDELAHMKPKDPTARQDANVAVPELPNDQTQAADVNFAATPMADPKNPLFMNNGSSGVRAPKQRAVQASSGPQPPLISGSTRQNQPLIALSAAPASAMPPAPVPAGNLSANVSISPQGQQTGSPVTAPKTSSSANGPNGISISGGQPRGLSGVSGLGAPGDTSRNLHVAPGSQAPPGAKNASETPLAARLPPGIAPEHLFGSRKVYTLHVSTPNVNSASGSWVMSFAEMDDGPNSLHPPRSGEMILPVAQHKEDPKYPPDFVEQKIEGEVVLYAIVREDGSVDSIQLVRGLDPTLDNNAMDALSHWKFSPAMHGGERVAVEAIVHVPFKAAQRDQY